MYWAPSSDPYADQGETERRALREFGEPIVGLAAASQPAAGRLVGYGYRNGKVATVTISYTAAVYLGPWAMVESSRRTGFGAGTSTSWSALRAFLKHWIWNSGEDVDDVEFAAGSSTIILDGQPVLAETVRTGTGWWAARCDRGAIEIRILAYKWDPGQVRVDTITDVEPLLAKLGPTVVLRPELMEPEPPAAEPQGEPHRVLVDVVLRSHLESMRWSAGRGRPPRPNPNWPRLWREAVRRQMELADQTKREADRAVQSFTSHLAGLQQEAAWFQSDDRLRQRAIAEILLYSTGLAPNVPSLPAQVAWQRLHNPVRVRPEPRAYAEARQEWSRAWAAWVETVA